MIITTELIDETVVVSEVVEELTEEETADRHQLELKVHKAFYDSGTALQELRGRRLYRSSHKTFEQYSRERFGFTRRHVDYLILSCQVFENLQMRTNGSHLLPTNERQVRSLAHLEPDEQYQIWQQAVEESGGKIPAGRIVQKLAKSFKDLDITSDTVSYQTGEVVEICADDNMSLRKHNGCWGIITHAGSSNLIVHISVRGINVQCKHQEIKKVDSSRTGDIRAVNERITVLVQLKDLSRLIIIVLETLGRQTSFTLDDLWLLEKLEERYGINRCAVELVE